MADTVPLQSTPVRASATRGDALRVALLVATAAFALRFLSLSGFSNDQFLHMSWAQLLWLGDRPGIDFVDPGMPLTYALSALAWKLAGSTMLGEALLTIGLLSLAHGVLAYAATRLTHSPAVGLAAGLVAAGFRTRLYSYPKLLAPAVATLFLVWLTREPRRRTWAWFGAWTGVTFLLRHDLAAPVALAAVVFGLADPRVATRRAKAEAAIAYLAGTALLVVPYVAFVAGWGGGVAPYLLGMAGFVAGEQNQWTLLTPALSLTPWSAWFDQSNVTAVLYYLLVAFLIAGIAVSRATSRIAPPSIQPLVAGLAWMGVVSFVILVRHPLVNRIADTAVIFAALGAVLGWIAWTRAPATVRVATRASVAAVAIVTGAVVAVYGHVWGDVQATHLISRPARWIDRTARQLQELTAWPWPNRWPNGDLPVVIEYLNTCTAPADRVLMTFFAPEYPVFADRGFATGYGEILPPTTFTSDYHRARMVAMLARQSAPVALVDLGQLPAFRRTYPPLAAVLDSRYRLVGRFTTRNGDIGVMVDGRVPVKRIHPGTGWPCFRR